MESPSEWTEEDLEVLIRDQVPESINLDYKECAALNGTDTKKNEVSKDVSAFANSAGGVIVYGIVEDKATHLPLKIDAGYDPTDITKEWLEQVINSRIQRRIDKVLIKPIELKKIAPKKFAFVVDIPQSPRAPHMASDKRYYKRFNFESVPMEEYEVRDVSRRLEIPDLRIGVPTGPFTLTFEADGTGSKPIELNLHLSNESLVPSEYAVIQLYVDERIGLASHGEMNDLGKATANDLGKEWALHGLQMNWGVPGKMPIFFGHVYGLSHPPISLAIPRGDSEYLFVSMVTAPRMAKKESHYLLRVKGATATIQPLGEHA